MADDKAKPGEGAMRIDAELVRTLAELLSDNELTEIEIEDGNRKIRVKREVRVEAMSQAAPAPTMTAGSVAAESLSAPVASAPSRDAVKSPMVGTAFLSTEPGGKPFISLGDTVKAGDTLLIVEAMKVMNPILAPTAGTVREILVANAQPVEYDQPLVVVE